jgi:tripartite-type tricarboxylate transporter receptor subunit TctC
MAADNERGLRPLSAIRMTRRSAVAAAAIPLTFASGRHFFAVAEELASFYQNKQIRLVICADPGGGYDLYARLAARFLSKRLPGNPIIVPENMPGAGGHTAANWLYNVAPKDGTVIGMLEQSTPLDQVLGVPGVQYDAAKFNWLGNSVIDNLITVVSKSSGVASIADLRSGKRRLFCGDIGAGPTTTMPHVINSLINANIKVVSGYPGAGDIYIAMDRGELNCIGGTTWSSMKAAHTAQLKTGKYVIILEWGTRNDPEISAYAGRSVPLSFQLAQNDLDRESLEFINSSSTIGKPLAAPPGTPIDRVAALRHAFAEAVKDPEFLQTAKRANMAIKPVSGADLQKLVTGIVHTPPQVVRRVLELVGQAGVQ